MYGQWLILAAAGRGERSGQSINKAFAPLGSTCALLMCLEKFAPHVEGATVAIGEGDVQLWDEISARANAIMPINFTIGGATRRASVAKALKSVPCGAEYIAVHDAARPFVSDKLIKRCFTKARQYGAVVPVIPIVDSVLMLNEDKPDEPLPRQRLRAVQTPQVFMQHWLQNAYNEKRLKGVTATDDAQLVREMGYTVAIVDGDPANRKLTTAEDFRLARLEIMDAMDDKNATDIELKLTGAPRVGFGMDAHRLVTDRALVLCGITIPFDKGLLGHSDADAAVHALIDALLGAAALGDIGQWFPDNDKAYEGISSIILLKRVVDGLAENGFRIINVDITIVAQRPKLASFMPEMRQVLANALGIDLQRVSVKATTTERMGYEGREEGISAHAVATIIQL
ncbi:bifunctional enzyme IspD/IspF [Clostridia bacterium]|nr:bifunctional enzyme IspD/IspF [Clostridia bacterium]